MEELERISKNQISSDILTKLAELSSKALKSTFGDSSISTPRFSKSVTPRPLDEISAIISKRRGFYTKNTDYDKENVFKRQLSIRPPRGESPERIRLESSQKERPMSEIAVPNEWRRQNWDVAAIEKRPLPPIATKPERRRPNPRYAKFEADETPEKIKKPTDKRGRNECSEDDEFKTPFKLKEKASRLESGKIPPKETENRNKPERISGTETEISSKLTECSAVSSSLKLPSIHSAPSKSSKKKKSKSQDKRQSFTRPQSDYANHTWASNLTTPAELCAPGWGSRTLDRRFLEQAARDLLDMDVVC